MADRTFEAGWRGSIRLIELHPADLLIEPRCESDQGTLRTLGPLSVTTGAAIDSAKTRRRRRSHENYCLTGVRTSDRTVADVPCWNAARSEQAIQVIARRYEFVPRVITLKKGVALVLELQSQGVTMRFNAPDFLIS